MVKGARPAITRTGMRERNRFCIAMQALAVPAEYYQRPFAVGTVPFRQFPDDRRMVGAEIGEDVSDADFVEPFEQRMGSADLAYALVFHESACTARLIRRGLGH